MGIYSSIFRFVGFSLLAIGLTLAGFILGFAILGLYRIWVLIIQLV